MLVLSRKEREIIIAGDVRITVIRIEGGRVRVGIEAPKSVKVLRGELEGKERAA